jgi:hypothetical protein
MGPEKIVKCLFGNGNCSPECQNYELSQDASKSLEDDCDSLEARKALLSDPRLRTEVIKLIRSVCINEGKEKADTK